MDLEQIKELMASIEGSKLKKLVVKKGDFELQLEKEGDHLPATLHLPPHYQSPRPLDHAVESAFHSEHAKLGAKQGAARATEVDGKFVVSPMVGTFYSSPSPDQPLFIKVGDRIEENTVVCIIEAMKVMNEVKAGVSGTVAEILIDNAQSVEFGSKIFRVV